ncbi:Ribonuclease H domain [Quillaja saponaria]|uniref:Ribonuclease H domain n=1 Tax=Quillaja saponaria TaxID=32244 RepID=A0AAD7LGG0_QUISA|nr:Ribonuclease H domain [Quillaja saponaria]
MLKKLTMFLCLIFYYISGEAATGGVIGYDEGCFVFAYASYLGVQSNMVAEFKASLEGLKLCAFASFFNIIIQSDSLALVLCVNSLKNPLRKLHGKFKELLHLMQLLKVSLSHYSQDVNSVADFLAKWACDYRARSF